MTQKDQNDENVRIDKWLWAARFFKTRSLAKAAIEGGKVHHLQDRIKVSRNVTIGMQLTIQQGFDKKTIVINKISSQRGPAPIAQMLYTETPESIEKRELIAAQRKLHYIPQPDHRPNKKERRDLHKFKQLHEYDWEE